jgi:hypothetical protein
VLFSDMNGCEQHVSSFSKEEPMKMRTRALPIAAALALTFSGTARAQEAPVPRCTPEQTELLAAVHDQRTPGRSLPAGRHPVVVCADRMERTVDGTSNTLVLGERVVPAELRGCPDDLGERGFGRATVRTRERPDGSLEVMVASTAHRGCTVSALMPLLEYDTSVGWHGALGLPSDLVAALGRGERVRVSDAWIEQVRRRGSRIRPAMLRTGGKAVLTCNLIGTGSDAEWFCWDIPALPAPMTSKTCWDFDGQGYVCLP